MLPPCSTPLSAESVACVRAGSLHTSHSSSPGTSPQACLGSTWRTCRRCCQVTRYVVMACCITCGARTERDLLYLQRLACADGVIFCIRSAWLALMECTAVNAAGLVSLGERQSMFWRLEAKHVWHEAQGDTVVWPSQAKDLKQLGHSVRYNRLLHPTSAEVCTEHATSGCCPSSCTT